MHLSVLALCGGSNLARVAHQPTCQPDPRVWVQRDKERRFGLHVLGEVREAIVQVRRRDACLVWQSLEKSPYSGWSDEVFLQPGHLGVKDAPIFQLFTLGDLGHDQWVDR